MTSASHGARTCTGIAQLGWRFNADQRSVQPVRPALTKEQDLTIEQLDQLTQYAVQLEQ